jgi:3-ketosteroid 9alpha-monooxygenase subunit A
MKGWYLAAFEREVTDELTPICVGHRRLMLVKDGERLRAYDATCPHRGAHLARGGRLDAGVVVCPFHGYRIRLGRNGGLSVDEYAVARAGGMVFVRSSADADNGWAGYLGALDREQFVVNGFEMSVRAPMETVIENAFDRRHFQSVHGVRTDDFVVRATEHGALLVESTFYVPDGSTAHGVAPAPYRALVVSPGLAAVELRGPVPYTVITGATDASAPGECTIRLSIAFPRAAWPEAPPPAVSETLLAHSRRGLDEDRVVWENLSLEAPPRWMPEDQPSLAFFDFCRRHRDG